jgi:hypothetical protein
VKLAVCLTGAAGVATGAAGATTGFAVTVKPAGTAAMSPAELNAEIEYVPTLEKPLVAVGTNVRVAVPDAPTTTGEPTWLPIAVVAMPKVTVVPGAKPVKVAVTPVLRYAERASLAGLTEPVGWATIVIGVVTAPVVAPVTVIVCAPTVAVLGRYAVAT